MHFYVSWRFVVAGSMHFHEFRSSWSPDMHFCHEPRLFFSFRLVWHHEPHLLFLISMLKKHWLLRVAGWLGVLVCAKCARYVAGAICMCAGCAGCARCAKLVWVLEGHHGSKPPEKHQHLVRQRMAQWKKLLAQGKSRIL